MCYISSWVGSYLQNSGWILGKWTLAEFWVKIFFRHFAGLDCVLPLVATGPSSQSAKHEHLQQHGKQLHPKSFGFPTRRCGETEESAVPKQKFQSPGTLTGMAKKNDNGFSTAMFHSWRLRLVERTSFWLNYDAEFLKDLHRACRRVHVAPTKWFVNCVPSIRWTQNTLPTCKT